MGENWNVTTKRVFPDVFSSYVIVVTYELRDSSPERLEDLQAD
jgi:hypothetical protein